MVKLNCPSCAAEVEFVSKATVFAVCKSCGSTLLRTDLKVEHIGKMAVLQNDPTPLQLQTGGIYNNRKFDLIGRIKQTWSDGEWNEWYAFFGDQNEAWLAEAQGFYMMSFPKTVSETLPDKQSLDAGLQVTLDKRLFTVEDVKEVKCTFSEGELPFKAEYGETSISVDLQGPDEDYACISYGEDKVRLYMGKYVKLEDLHLNNLRKFDGW